MSSKKENSASATTNGTKYEARLCHVVKRADFDGYGFNLHAEKGRPGQYIGKVDDGSPAEAAGLRQGDRILEVNGTNITHETHKKVVELIKGVPNETNLLVIDPRADPTDLKAAMSNAAGKDVNDSSKQQQSQQPQQANGKGTTADEKSKGDVNGSNSNSEESNNKKNASKNISSTSNGSSANNNDDTSANKMMMTNGESEPAMKQQQQQQKPVVDQIIEDTKAMTMATSVKAAESNGKPAAATNGSSKGAATPTTKEAPKLNLNMTAAELRAQLAARKKYDPKNDVCDLRKKYEIIQKM